jgi:tetratricopeptide (TPR) repeat protein
MAVSVMLAHGVVDVLLYSSRFLPLLFLPMGLTVAALRRTNARRPKETQSALVLRAGLVALVIIPIIVVALLAREQILAAWYANLGSVIETRAELVPYHWPDHLVEYQRRDVNMAEAELNFQRALDYETGNVTASQRLASIALARGQYNAALEYLDAAYAHNANDAITWELLGEAYLGVGQIDQAYTFWSRIPDAAPRLERLSHVRFGRMGDNTRAQWALALAARMHAVQ